MDVRELKKQLEGIDENLEVLICTKASKNYMDIDFITVRDSTVVIVLNDIDFCLDREGMSKIEEEKKEFYTPDWAKK